MSGIPLPSTTTKSPPRKGRGLYQVAKSKRGLSLLLILTLSSLFYILDAGPLLGRLGSHRGAEVPAWPKVGDEPAVDSGTEASMETSIETPPPTPLSSLGLEADMSFHLGSTSKAVYRTELEQFVARAFPSWLRDKALASIELYLGDSDGMVPFPEMPHKIYQTAKKEPHWGWDTSSWRKVPDYEHVFFDDAAADAWVRKGFSGTEIEVVWDVFGPGIKRSDLLRYLLVMTEGGIYTDMDTRRLKDISLWGNGADTRGLSHMGLPSIFVGIEADVGTRSDWRKWWPRPLQIVQWTFGAAPLHPILIDTVRRVHHVTAVAEASKTKSGKGTGANIQAGEHWVGGELLRDDGSISIMEWTGPGVFTDSVLRYLAAEHNTSWPALKNLRRPVRIRDTVVLPVTGFSPGVGLFGAGEPTDREAMVHHLFAGSWKTGKHNE